MHACVVVGTRGICAVQILGFFDGSCGSGGEGEYGPLVPIGRPVVRRSLLIVWLKVKKLRDGKSEFV